jgi:hypothetical protein
MSAAIAAVITSRLSDALRLEKFIASTPHPASDDPPVPRAR